MREELLWSLFGGVLATLFNVFYNYIRETRNRRWLITSEICATTDYYYLRLVKAFAHLECVLDEKQEALNQKEWRTLQNDISPIFIDEQKIRAEIDIVFGVDSYESDQFDVIFLLLKNNLELIFSPNIEKLWIDNKNEIKNNINKIARIRPIYRQKLVKKSKGVVYLHLTNQLKYNITHPNNIKTPMKILGIGSNVNRLKESVPP